jgi:hypothetical protein
MEESIDRDDWSDLSSDLFFLAWAFPRRALTPPRLLAGRRLGGRDEAMARRSHQVVTPPSDAHLLSHRYCR